MDATRLQQLALIRSQRDIALEQVEELTEAHTNSIETCLDTADQRVNRFSRLTLSELRALELSTANLLKVEDNLDTRDPGILAAIYGFVMEEGNVHKCLNVYFERFRDHLLCERASFLQTFEPLFDFFISPEDSFVFAFFDKQFVLHGYDQYERIVDQYVKRQAILLAKATLYDYYADLQLQLHNILSNSIEPSEDAVFKENELAFQYKNFAQLQLARSALLPVFIALSPTLHLQKFDDTDVLSLYQRAKIDLNMALFKCADLFKDGEIPFSPSEVPLNAREREFLSPGDNISEYLLKQLSDASTPQEFMQVANSVFRQAVPLHLESDLRAHTAACCSAFLQQPQLNKDEPQLAFLEFCERNFVPEMAEFGTQRAKILETAARRLMQTQIDCFITNSGEPPENPPFYAAEVAGMCKALWAAEGPEALNSMRYLGVAKLRSLVLKICQIYGNIEEIEAWVAGFEFANEDSG